VKSLNRKESTDTIADVLRHVRKKGVRLWSANGQLHYKAPEGALTQEEMERLRGCRAQIVALLKQLLARKATNQGLSLCRTSIKLH